MAQVSIIVPVYNVESYLEKCLLSIKKQTFTDIEVIVINDGSTDQSGVIAEKICSHDNRFIFIDQPNNGLGNTRNVGIEKASGEYLAFVDSDDYISEHMIEVLYSKAVLEQADIVCGEMILVYPDQKNVIRSSYAQLAAISLKETSQETFYRDYFFSGVYSPNAVDKLYRASPIKQCNIRFGDNKRIFGEDNYFQLQLLLKINKIAFVNEVIYYYIQRDGSIMNSYKTNLMERQLQMVKDYEAISNQKISKKVASLLVFDAVIMEIVNIVNSKKSFRDFYKKMLFVRKDDFFNHKIRDVVDMKSSRLVINKQRRFFITLVSWLEKIKFTKISSAIIYFVYFIRSSP